MESLNPDVPLGSRERGNVAVRLFLKTFSSIWVGIVLATLLFLYCSVGSAIIGVRQALEMTEFQWFHWWPFNALVILFAMNMVVATLRRVPWRKDNVGVWMIHTGIVILTLGSYYYFGTKIEGDTPVFRRLVNIELPKQSEPASIVALPGNRTSVVAGPDRWMFEVQGTNTAWPILTEGHEGERAYAVNVAVTPPNGKMFIRQLLAGYPQFTEDVIPGQGRAVKSTGKKLLHDELKLSLELAPQHEFFVMDTWALYVRRLGEKQWTERPILGMPRYSERISSRDHVFIAPGDRDRLSIEPIDLPIEKRSAGDALSPATARVTGFLPYAHMERRWRDGGHSLNPVLSLSVLSGGASSKTHELVAFDPRHNHLENGVVEFIWLSSPDEVEGLPKDSRATLSIAVPDKNVEFNVPVTQELVAGRDGPMTRVLGTEFEYRMLSVQDHLTVGAGRTISVAMVEVKTPEGETFTRMVASDPEKTRDMRGDNADPHSSNAVMPQESEPRIVMAYQPASAPIMLAAHPQGLYYVFNRTDGTSDRQAVEIGQTVEVVPGLALRLNAYWQNAEAEMKPRVVPPHRRDKNAGLAFAMIRLEIETPKGVQSQWLSYNHYVFPDPQYAVSGRFAYLPERFRLEDGSDIEVMFSRERRPLPNAVSMSGFDLDTHVGGYAGDASTIRNYECRLRFENEGTWSEPTRVAVNHPTENGGYWYFQSTWDKPPPNNPNSGMNYTGLGVGNRNGVYIQLFGCCLSAAGMIFAFYIKPYMRRKLRPRAQASAEAEVGETIEREQPTEALSV